MERHQLYKGRIISDPAVMLGKPVIAGTRITVELILELLSGGATVDDILNEYPHLKREDGTLGADRALFQLGPENQVQRVLAIGNVTTVTRMRGEKPPTAAIEIVDVPLEPRVSNSEVGVAPTVKSGAMPFCHAETSAPTSMEPSPLARS